jgi:hypothetical protein
MVSSGIGPRSTRGPELDPRAQHYGVGIATVL